MTGNGQCNAVFNLSLDKFVTDQSLSKSTDKIAGALDKAVNKVSGELKSNTDKLASVTKDSAEKSSQKIADAVKQIKTTNASQLASPAAVALGKGLNSIGSSVSRMVDDLRSNPSEIDAVVQAARATNQNLGTLVDSVSDAVASGGKMQMATEEVMKSSDWVGSNFAGSGNNPIPISNAFGRVAGSFGDLLK
jgi:hypothetical protein